MNKHTYIEREAFEKWYVENAFDYEQNPIGSRDCGLQWKAWQAACANLAGDDAVERLAQGEIPAPFALDTPITGTVEFFTSDMADRATRIPFTKREGTRVSLTAQDMSSAYNGFRAMVMLAAG